MIIVEELRLRDVWPFRVIRRWGLLLAVLGQSAVLHAVQLSWLPEIAYMFAFPAALVIVTWWSSSVLGARVPKPDNETQFIAPEAFPHQR